MYEYCVLKTSKMRPKSESPRLLEYDKKMKRACETCDRFLGDG